MSVADAELAEARAALALAKAREIELSSLYLQACTKLGTIAAAFALDPSVSVEDFKAAVADRAEELGAKPIQ